MDILHVRVRTTGIAQQDLPFSPLPFSRPPPAYSLPDMHMFIGGYEVTDVGGARTERRKWIHAMDSVNGNLPFLFVFFSSIFLWLMNFFFRNSIFGPSQRIRPNAARIRGRQPHARVAAPVHRNLLLPPHRQRPADSLFHEKRSFSRKNPTRVAAHVLPGFFRRKRILRGARFYHRQIFGRVS
jgi:hypothetical protein